MADTTRLTNDSEEQIKPETRRARLRRHCARFWWLYVLLFIAIVLCVVLPIIYVAYPRQAQSSVDASVIVPKSESVTDATPTSFFYNNSAILNIFSSYQPELYSWNGSYYNERSDTPFLSVTIPEIKAENGVEINIAQDVQIFNMNELIRNNDLLIRSANFSIYLKGTGGLKQGGLPYTNVNYDKKIDLVGLNRFEGLSMTEFHLLNQTQADGSNAAGTVRLPNPSIFSLAMGDVALNLSVNGTQIGNATLPDFNLLTGTHEYPLRVTSNQSSVLTLLQQPAYRCGVLPVEILGQSSTVNGVDIPYFSRPLQRNVLRTSLNLTTALQDAGLGSLITGPCET